MNGKKQKLDDEVNFKELVELSEYMGKTDDKLIKKYLKLMDEILGQKE